jgi:hypothetical protein
MVNEPGIPGFLMLMRSIVCQPDTAYQRNVDGTSA